MKIGIDASRANSREKTGTEWYSFRLIQEFKKIAEANDQFFLYSKDRLDSGLENLPKNFKSRILRWPPKFLWTQIRLSLQLFFHRVDVLFVPAHTLPLINCRKTVLTVHDIGFERFEQLYSQKTIGPKNLFKKLINFGVRMITIGRYGSNELDYHRWAMKFAIEHAKIIIVPSKFTKDEIIQVYGISPDRIKVVYHGVDNERYYQIINKEKISDILNKYRINVPYFLFIGRLEKKKNTAGLVKAYSIFKQKYKLPHALVLVGNPGYGFEEIRDLVLKNNLSRQVIMPGYVQAQDLVYLLNGAEAFVFPSYYEGFGLPILEAMACGVPVITSQRASIPEISGQAAQQIDPNNYEEFARALYLVSSNPQIKNEMIRLGLEHVKKYSWKDCARETLEIIKQA